MPVKSWTFANPELPGRILRLSNQKAIRFSPHLFLSWVFNLDPGFRRRRRLLLPGRSEQRRPALGKIGSVYRDGKPHHMFPQTWPAVPDLFQPVGRLRLFQGLESIEEEIVVAQERQAVPAWPLARESGQTRLFQLRYGVDTDISSDIRKEFPAHGDNMVFSSHGASCVLLAGAADRISMQLLEKALADRAGHLQGRQRQPHAR